MLIVMDYEYVREKLMLNIVNILNNSCFTLCT